MSLNIERAIADILSSLMRVRVDVECIRRDIDSLLSGDAHLIARIEERPSGEE